METFQQRLELEEIITYLKEYAYAFSHGEIYGGAKNVYDFGPLGFELKNKIINAWRECFIQEQNNIYEMDSAILTLPEILKNSGHVEKFQEKRGWKFTQPFFYDLSKKSPAEQTSRVLKNEVDFPFGLLFSVPLIDDSNKQMRNLYLRPETAQGIFVNFNKVVRAMKLTLPFGLAQTGKSFRKEVNSAHFIMRAWEFEQMEIEYFFEALNPNEITVEFSKWSEILKTFFTKKLCIPQTYLRNIIVEKNSSPHYAKKTEDWEFQLPNHEWLELASLADRGQYDLTQHHKNSQEELSLRNAKNEKIIAHVVEPSIGINRVAIAMLSSHLYYEKTENKKRLVLKLPARFCYYQIAVLPLTEALTFEAKTIWKYLQKQKSGKVAFFSKKSIGQRYAYQDAIGTKFCVTYDFESTKNQTVTIRERDTRQQVKISIAELAAFFNDKF